jgi:hypothetical protein
MNCELMLTYDSPALQQTGSKNLMGQKTLPTIWGTYIKLGSVFGPVRFLLPVWQLSLFLYTLNIYAHFSSHFSQPRLCYLHDIHTLTYTDINLAALMQLDAEVNVDFQKYKRHKYLKYF